MTDADGFVREETVDIFLGMLDESELEQLFEEETDNIKLEVISYEHVLIYFTGLLWFSEYFKKLCPANWFWTQTSLKQIQFLPTRGYQIRVSYSRSPDYNHYTMLLVIR